MKGITITSENIKEIFVDEIAATSLYKQYREMFPTIHYISGIDVFDDYFGDLKFNETTATLQIVSCRNAIFFDLEHNNVSKYFGIYRSQIKEVKTEDNVEINVRSINRITKTIKSVVPIIPMLIGTVADSIVKVKSRNVKGKLYKLIVEEENVEHQIIFSSMNENNHKQVTDDFVFKHLTKSLPTKDKEGCYIATLCYGSYDAEEVIIFRKFRDSILKNSYFGIQFIKMYYFISPRLARFLSNKSLINKIIRNYILNPLSAKIRKSYDL